VKSLGSILAEGNVAGLAASGQRESSRESNRQREVNTVNLWASAVSHSKALFGQKRLWRVLVVETTTSEMIIASRGAPADGTVVSFPIKRKVASTAPSPLRYFVRWRLAKDQKPEWVEVVLDHVDPLDFDSPRAWQLRPSKEQRERSR
jgi:hypothetical protein